MRLFRRTEQYDAQPDLRLLVGLGNPGRRYERTRHNVGFMVADEVAARAGGSFRKATRHRADTIRVTIDGIPLLLAKPITYMNESGIAVRHLTDYYRVPLGRLLIVCDDIDLPFGTIRIRPGGSSGGNGGLKSIIRELGTEEFPRLRLGVSRPRSSAVSHVLAAFPPEEERLLPTFIARAADASLAVLRDGVQTSMNAFNRNWREELEG